MQEVKKNKSRNHENKAERVEKRNLNDVTAEQMKMNIGLVLLGKTIKEIQVVIKILLCVLTILLSFLAILLHEASNWMLATWTNLSMEELVAQMKTCLLYTSRCV